MGKVTGAGSGKLLLFGEHAAVYGHPAVGIHLPMETVISHSESGAAGFPGLDMDDQRSIESLFGFIRETMPDYADCLGGTWTFQSSIPREAGYGSSAAVCAALAEILLNLRYGVSPSKNDIWAAANTMERFFHGTPSGIDTGLSVYGGMRSFHPRPSGLPEQRAVTGGPLYLVTGAVKREGNTRELIAGLRERMTADHHFTVDCLNELGYIARESISVLGRSPVDGAALDPLIHRADEVLGLIGLNHPAVRFCIDSEISHGALAGKLSGAGNGGAFYIRYAARRDAVAGCGRMTAAIPEIMFAAALEWSAGRTSLLSEGDQ